MRRIRLLVAYNGSEFSGFQRQGPGGPPTVQSELEKALSQIINEPVELKAAGRTDAGVHATGQVIAFDCRHPRPVDIILKGGNALLPPTIRLLEGAEVELDFHPRFSAQSRVYHYHLVTESPGLFFGQTAWCLPHRLDFERMRKAAEPLLGEHDFSSYCSRVPADESRIRSLTRLDISPSSLPELPIPFSNLRGHLTFRLEANAFLRRMVRLLVAALIEVGKGGSVAKPAEVLAARNPAAAPPPAPPQGLYLVKVNYKQPGTS